MHVCILFVCTSRFPDVRGDVFVAGWGAVHDMKCTTNEFGPQPNTKCKFPFKFKSISFTGCVSMPSPSNYEDVCNRSAHVTGFRLARSSQTHRPCLAGWSGVREWRPFPSQALFTLMSWQRRKRVWSASASIRPKANKVQAKKNYLVIRIRSNRVPWFSYSNLNFAPSLQGWCGTCMANATEPGQEGYCGPGSFSFFLLFSFHKKSPSLLTWLMIKEKKEKRNDFNSRQRNDDSEAVQVSPFANWGFCNRHCAIQDPLTNMLQVSTYTPHLCIH